MRFLGSIWQSITVVSKIRRSATELWGNNQLFIKFLQNKKYQPSSWHDLFPSSKQIVQLIYPLNPASIPLSKCLFHAFTNTHKRLPPRKSLYIDIKHKSDFPARNVPCLAWESMIESIWSSVKGPLDLWTCQKSMLCFLTYPPGEHPNRVEVYPELGVNKIQECTEDHLPSYRWRCAGRECQSWHFPRGAPFLYPWRTFIRPVPFVYVFVVMIIGEAALCSCRSQYDHK